MPKKKTIHQRLDYIENILINEIRHELSLHRWLLGIILGGSVTVLVGLIFLVVELVA